MLGNPPALTTAAASKEDDEVAEDPAFLPIHALVLAFRKERDAVILDVFCQNETRRALLIRALGRWADTLDEDLIIRMISSPALTEEERDLFGSALAELHGKEIEFARRFGNLDGAFGGEAPVLAAQRRRWATE